MIRALPFVALAALSACVAPVSLPAPPPRPAPPVVEPAPVELPRSSKERFVTAVEANGCSFNAGNSSAVLAAATLSEDELPVIITQLRNEGRVAVSDGGQGFRLTTSACA